MFLQLCDLDTSFLLKLLALFDSDEKQPLRIFELSLQFQFLLKTLSLCYYNGIIQEETFHSDVV